MVDDRRRQPAKLSKDAKSMEVSKRKKKRSRSLALRINKRNKIGINEMINFVVTDFEREEEYKSSIEFKFQFLSFFLSSSIRFLS